MTKYLFPLIAIVVFILLINLPAKIRTTIPPITTKFRDIKADLETGDIIFFRSTLHDNLLNCLAYEFRTIVCGKSPWGHIGLVYRREDGELYLLEFRYKHDTIFKQFMEPDYECQMVNLEYFLEKYQMTHNAYFGLRKISRPICNRNLNQKFMDCRNHVFRPFWKIILLTGFPKIFHPRCSFEDGEMFCSEFVAYLLMQTGVFKDRMPQYLYIPYHFEKIYDNQNLNEGYSYSDTILFRN